MPTNYMFYGERKERSDGFLTNMRKDRKAAVEAAVAESGAPVQWRDEPNEQMAFSPLFHDYGSIWRTTPRADLTNFWKVLNSKKRVMPMAPSREKLQQDLAVLRKAEADIQRILLRLEEQVGRIDHVEVDTRNFANCKTEIFLKTE